MGFKQIGLLLVGGLASAILYNACSPMMSASNSISGFSQQEIENFSKNTFANTLYPVLRNNCAQCHGVNQNPKFAVADLNAAFNAIQSNNLVSLSNPSSSTLYLKISGGHNNFPVALIDEVLLQIQTWSRTLQEYIDHIDDIDLTPIEFNAADVSSVLAKVKSTVNGGALTKQEWDQSTASALKVDDLRQLAQKWIETPEGQARLATYLETLLHQDVTLGVDSDDLFNSVRVGAFQNALRESFVRTAMDLIQRNRPFNEIATTNRFAVNTVLLSAYAWMETAYSNQQRRDFNILLRSTNVTAADYADWRFVTFANGAATPISQTYDDLAYWRSVANNSTLNFGIPRVGYFSSLGFQAQYPSNVDNQFRVTINQTLIAGLGKTFNPADATVQALEVGIPPDHAEKGSQCYACHRLMDPMRLAFGFTMRYNYRIGQTFNQSMGSFAFNNFTSPLRNLQDLGSSIANHPDFAEAWVQKTCEVLNTKKCVINDPAFQQIVARFKQSNLNFKQMYIDVVTSPLVTGADTTLTSEQAGFDVARNRREHFCHSMRVKLNQIREARGMALVAFDSGAALCNNNNVRNPADAIGDDLNVRGGESIVNSFPQDAFSSQAYERACTGLVGLFVNTNLEIDQVNVTIPENIRLLTEYIVGLPAGHPRHAPMRQALQATYSEALNNQGMNSRDALRQAAILACQAPDTMGVGL